MKTILLHGRIDGNTHFILKRLSKFCSETKAKIIQDRISLAERHFGQLCDDVASFTRKCARLRDKGKKKKSPVSYHMHLKGGKEQFFFG